MLGHARESWQEASELGEWCRGRSALRTARLISKKSVQLQALHSCVYIQSHVADAVAGLFEH